MCKVCELIDTRTRLRQRHRTINLVSSIRNVALCSRNFNCVLYESIKSINCIPIDLASASRARQRPTRAQIKIESSSDAFRLEQNRIPSHCSRYVTPLCRSKGRPDAFRANLSSRDDMRNLSLVARSVCGCCWCHSRSPGGVESITRARYS